MNLKSSVYLFFRDVRIVRERDIEEVISFLRIEVKVHQSQYSVPHSFFGFLIMNMGRDVLATTCTCSYHFFLVLPCCGG